MTSPRPSGAAPRPSRRSSTRAAAIALLVLTFVGVHTSRADEAQPPPLDDAIAAARARGRALVVEFSTVWCKPCERLAREVLPHPDVKAALDHVMFVQYDAERGAGRDAAKRLQIEGFPTLVALGSDGAPVERLTGVRSPAELSAWIRSMAGRARPSLTAMLGEIRKRPRDAALALEIGRRQSEAGRLGLARRFFTAASKNAARGSPVATEAEWEVVRLAVVEAEHKVRGKAIGGWLAKHASAPGIDPARLVEAADIYSFAGPPRAEAERVLGAVVATLVGPRNTEAKRAPSDEDEPRSVTPEAAAQRHRLRSIVRTCLRARAFDAALAAALALDEDTAGLMLRAEVRHQRGEKDAAIAAGDKALALTSARDRGFVEHQLQRYRRGDADPGDSLVGEDPLDPFRPSLHPPAPIAAPPPDSRERAAQSRMAVFRDLVSRVSRACGVYARSGPRRAWVRVKLVDGKIDRVLLLEPDVPVLLAGCLTGELRGQPFVHPVEGEDTFAIQF